MNASHADLVAPIRALRRLEARARRRASVYGQDLSAALREVSEELEAMADMQEWTPEDRARWCQLQRLEARLAAELRGRE